MRSRVLAIGAVVLAGGAFAMAICGDARGEHHSLDPVEAARDQARAAREDALAQERREGAETDARLLAALIAGPRAGQPGPTLASIRFGTVGVIASETEVGIATTDVEAHRGELAVDAASGSISVSIPRATADAIRARWGAPGADGAWDDAADRVVATITGGGRARIAWTSYETLAHLLAPDPVPGATPLSVVGMCVAELQLAGAHLEHDTRRGAIGWDYQWRLPPAHGDTIASSAGLRVDQGVITSVSLGFDGDADAVLDALHAAYGDPAHGPWRHDGVVIEAQGHPDGALVTARLAK